VTGATAEVADDELEEWMSVLEDAERGRGGCAIDLDVTPPRERGGVM